MRHAWNKTSPSRSSSDRRRIARSSVPGVLKNEVRKAAALDHPAIVRVHDHGEVPDSIGVDSLIRESLFGDGVRAAVSPLRNPRLGADLPGLDAAARQPRPRPLARRIHRDLKPGNVLLRRATGGVMLTDFGRARAGDTDGGPVLNAGTPSYMAGANRTGLRRHRTVDRHVRTGVFMELAVRSTPVSPTLSRKCSAIVRPVLEPASVPNGVEAWINNSLHKSPRHRYVRAADAMHALLPMALSTPSTPCTPSRSSRPQAPPWACGWAQPKPPARPMTRRSPPHHQRTAEHTAPMPKSAITAVGPARRGPDARRG